MKNPYVEHDILVISEPFEHYLKLCNENMDDFVRHLKEKNISYIKPLLDPLFHYGLIDILLPLNELIPYLLENESLTQWWKETIKEMENNYIVRDFENDLTNMLGYCTYILISKEK